MFVYCSPRQCWRCYRKSINLQVFTRSVKNLCDRVKEKKRIQKTNIQSIDKEKPWRLMIPKKKERKKNGLGTL